MKKGIRKKALIVLVVLLALGMVTMTACGGNEATPEPDPAPVAEPEPAPEPEAAPAEEPEPAGWAPVKAITMVVPTSPGDYYDTQARCIADYIEAALGQPVTIEYMPGAGQAIAAKYVYDSEPDGYTIGYASSLPLVVNQLFYDGEWDYASMNYFGTCMDQCNDPAFLELPVSTLPGTKFESWDDVLNSTTPVRWASVGQGSAMHVVGVILAAKYGFPIEHMLGYQGGNEVAAAIARNEADTGALPWSVLEGLVAEDDVKGIFNIGAGHSDNFPDSPSFGDDYPEIAQVLATRHFVYGPPGMDQEIVDTLGKIIFEAVNTDAMKQIHVDGISSGIHYVTDDGPGTKDFMLKLGEIFKGFEAEFSE
ncbi:MAG: tripartite tricarboxylate transporter substrate-binding protein [Clostridiales bacterium]|nr:tripartite tricarboxylate transporter substrate-binding protein [Clostridiales bacterium]